MAENDINNEEQYKIAADKLMEFYRDNKLNLKNYYNKKNVKKGDLSLEIIENTNEINKIYDSFNSVFSLEQLKLFKDEDILNKFLRSEGNKEDLCYKLEYAVKVGEIGPCTPYQRYGLYKDKNGWHLGDSLKNSELIDKEKAIKEGKKQLDLIVKGGRIIEKYIRNNQLFYITNYDELDKELSKETFEFSKKTWVRKYYHMVFPDYFCNWFSDDILKEVLDKLGINKQAETYFGKNGQLMKIYRETGLNNPVLVGNICLALLHDNKIENKLERKDKTEKANAKLSSLNTILYGPPGTGKTYNTAIYAVAICDGKTIEEVKNENYQDVLKRYKELKNAGRIAFTTFHQSYGYEEFIEGIKPVLDEESSNSENSELKYTLEKGIFRTFCENISEKASLNTLNNRKNYGFNDNPTVWKVSLFKSYDNPIREECLKNGHIRIGWEEYGPDISDEVKYEIGGKTQLDCFINKMQIGDIVFSCYNQTMIDAIGVITGDYEWDNSFKDHNRVRKVNWIIKDKIDIKELNSNKNMVQSTVYRMSITVSDVKRLLTEKYPDNFDSNNQTKSEPYVFIIDEINRGNISKVFGELITLIEDKKRIGNLEEMETILPYSRKPFGVPNNLYIIGTMNTSDRSIASIDIALRRRFTFKEMMPDSKLVPEKVENIEFKEIFENLNKRITLLLDRDHQIGHSYFMNVKNIDDLKKVWFNSIMPLLNEYFYNDWEKLKLIIPGFIKSIDIPQNLKDECESAYEFKSFDEMKDDTVFIEALNQIDFKE